jgi:hypothetical protein
MMNTPMAKRRDLRDCKLHRQRDIDGGEMSVFVHRSNGRRDVSA